VPYRSVQETNRTVQEPYRTVQKAYCAVQEPYHTVQKAYRTVQDNLYANPAPKSVPYRAEYHVTLFSDQAITLQLVMIGASLCRRT
jgi:hypothetical protein